MARIDLAHARRRVAPRHREALGDVRLDLAAEAEDEPTLRSSACRSLADVGQRSSGCGRRRRRSTVPSSIVCVCSAASSSGKNGSWLGLRRPDARVAGLLAVLGVCRRLGQIEPDASVDLHGPNRSATTRVHAMSDDARRGGSGRQSPLVAEVALELGRDLVAGRQVAGGSPRGRPTARRRTPLRAAATMATCSAFCGDQLVEAAAGGPPPLVATPRPSVTTPVISCRPSSSATDAPGYGTLAT